MKKLILTAAIGMSTVAFGQNGNIFGSSALNEEKTVEKTVVASPVISSRVAPSAMAVGNKTQACIDAEKAWERRPNNNPNSDKYRRLRDAVKKNCGYDPVTQTGPTVPVDMLAFPLLASALALVVAFRKRIAGKLS